MTPLSLYSEIGLSSVRPAAAAGGQQSAPEEVPNLKTDRVTSIPTVEVGSGIAVSEGSYDPSAIKSALEEGSLDPSNTSGVYAGEDPRFGGTQRDVKIAGGWSDRL